VHEKSIPLETTLTMVTKNPATRLKLYPQKGALAPGSDADILALQKEDLSIVHLIFKGKTAMRNGAILIKGKYEP
jgi:beta-aspartyl-dipeptidase (metallo-type)